VDRRLAALAARLTEIEDPPHRYKVQLLTGHLEGVLEQTMVERIVGTARELERVGGPVEFLQKYGESSRLLKQLPGTAEQVAVRLFDLHRRHASQINGVLDHELAERHAKGRWHDLPPTCILRVLAGRPPELGLSTGAGRNAVVPRCPHKPSKEDWRILLALANAPHSLFLNDLRERVKPKLSRRTLGTRLRIMQRYGLIHYPNGERKGAALDEAGRALLEQKGRRRAL
jgi:hypothetical protein